MPSFQQVYSLYGQSPETVMAETGDFTRRQFSSAEHQPVLICAYNEEQDLPVTLAALARSAMDIHPVVVDNGSTDRTAEFAQALGATVLEEPAPAKVHALKTGLDCLFQQGREVILLTDADTVMGRRWADLLIAQMRDRTASHVVEGAAVFHSGERGATVTDFVRSCVVVGRHILRAAGNSELIGRGHNMAINAPSGRVQNAIHEALGECSLTTDDSTIGATLRKEGIGQFITDPRSIVITRGDRMPNLVTLAHAKVNGTVRKGSLYADWFERAGSLESVEEIEIEQAA